MKLGPLSICAVCFLFSCLHASAQSVTNEVVIEIFVDGPSMVHVTPSDIYLENGANAKPGLWGGHDEPTYVNGVAWKPEWHKSHEHTGPGRTDYYPLKFG